MTVVPELEDIYNRYKKNKQSREYGRFVHFSNWIRRCPDYQKNLPLFDDWKRNTKLKNVEIHKVIEHFSNLGLPKQPDCSKRFGECQRLWIAAFWPTYGPILESCQHHVENGTENNSTIYSALPETVRSYLEAQYGVVMPTEHFIDTKKDSPKFIIKSSLNNDNIQLTKPTALKKQPKMKNVIIHNFYNKKVEQTMPVFQIQRAPSEPVSTAQSALVFCPTRYMTERSQVITSPYSQIIAGPSFWV